MSLSTATKAPPRRAPSGPLYPQLRARRNASPEAVAAHQRARLHAAMIEASTARGYAATTVNQVVALAGVSKKTLYRHFESKEECFLATYDLVVRDAVARISAAYRGAGTDRDWAAALCRAFDAFVEELLQRPAPSQLALVEVLAAGPAALERIERAEALFSEMIAQSLAEATDGLALPPPLPRSLIGGIWFVTRQRLLEGRPAAISASAHPLLEWILSYRTPADLPFPDLTPASVLPCAEPSAPAGDERTRMLRAAAQIAVSGGYLGLTVGQIVEAAAVPPTAFSAHFESPGQCFLASLELLTAEALARALQASDGAPDWPTALCRAIAALLRHTATNPVFAGAAFVEVFAAGPVGIERRGALIRAFAALLARRAPRASRPSPLIAEAIVGAIWSIAHHHVTHRRAHALPSAAAHASYLALAPIIGAEPALDVIFTEFA